MDAVGGLLLSICLNTIVLGDALDDTLQVFCGEVGSSIGRFV